MMVIELCLFLCVCLCACNVKTALRKSDHPNVSHSRLGNDLRRLDNKQLVYPSSSGEFNCLVYSASVQTIALTDDVDNERHNGLPSFWRGKQIDGRSATLPLKQTARKRPDAGQLLLAKERAPLCWLQSCAFGCLNSKKSIGRQQKKQPGRS